MLIIDAHTHPTLVRSHDTPESLQAVVNSARAAGISGLCVLGDVLRYGFLPTGPQVREINDITADMVSRYPRFMAGFCFLNPGGDAGFIRDEIDRCIADRGFKGIKLEVSVNCRDRRLDVIMTRAAQYNIPVIHHCWYKTVGRVAAESDPADLADLAARFPEVKIVMAHLTGCGIRGIFDIQPFANVYVDTSGSQPVAGLVEYAVAALGADRVIFGSDIPGRDFSCQIGRIEGAAISRHQKAMILGLNAARLFGWEGDQG